MSSTPTVQRHEKFPNVAKTCHDMSVSVSVSLNFKMSYDFSNCGLDLVLPSYLCLIAIMLVILTMEITTSKLHELQLRLQCECTQVLMPFTYSTVEKETKFKYLKCNLN